MTPYNEPDVRGRVTDASSQVADKAVARVVNVLFDDRLAGPSSRVIQVGRRLKQHRVETVICMPEGAGEAAALATERGVRIRRIPMSRIPRPGRPWAMLRWLVALPRDVGRLRTVFREEGAEVVHVNGAFFLAPAIAARLGGLALVWHLNDTIVPRKAAWVLGQMVRAVATRIVVAAKAVARHYGVSGTAHDVIYAPVDVDRFDAGRLASRRDRDAPLRVACIANWYPEKGIEYFVRACAMVRDELPGRRLEVVLAGAKLETQADYCRDVETLIDKLGLRGATRYLGFVREVPEVLAGLDILALSSVSEACPMVVLEAMSSALPVVATDVGGVRELLAPDTDERAGLVIPPRDPVAMARAIRALVESPELAAQLGRNGRRRACEKFSLDQCSERHLRVYRLALGREFEADSRVADPGR